MFRIFPTKEFCESTSSVLSFEAKDSKVVTFTANPLRVAGVAACKVLPSVAKAGKVVGKKGLDMLKEKAAKRKMSSTQREALKKEKEEAKKKKEVEKKIEEASDGEKEELKNKEESSFYAKLKEQLKRINLAGLVSAAMAPNVIGESHYAILTNSGDDDSTLYSASFVFLDRELIWYE